METISTRETRKATGHPYASVVPTRQRAAGSAATPRLTLVEARNDDGHVVGLEPCWITLGDAAKTVVARLAGEGR